MAKRLPSGTGFPIALTATAALVLGPLGIGVYDGANTVDLLEPGNGSMFGGNGDDTLNGGDGHDVLRGGGDRDACLQGEDVRRCET